MGKKKKTKPKKKSFEEMFEREEAEQKRSYAEDPIVAGQSSLGVTSRPEGLDDLVGGRVLAVGFHPAAREGGLAIDYERESPKGVVYRRRMVLGYTDLGLWVEWNGNRADSSLPLNAGLGGPPPGMFPEAPAKARRKAPRPARRRRRP